MHEDFFINRAKLFPSHPDIMLGIGDDAALLKPSGQTLVWAVDTMVENTHFLRTMPAAEIGWKLLAVNLSDLAAMNAKPIAALLSFGAPSDLSPTWLSEFWDGLEHACQTYQVALAGGDTVRSSELHLSLSVLGQSTYSVQRKGAQAGDKLVVTGSFGGSAAGLYCFQQQLEHPDLLKRHWHPIPRFKEAELLVAESQRQNTHLALLDTSDGLARSLQLICESNQLGCIINGSAIPTQAGLAEFPAQAQNWALNGGEDYELLAALPAQTAEQLDPELFTIIGSLTSEPEQLIQYPNQTLDIRQHQWGFQHF